MHRVREWIGAPAVALAGFMVLLAPLLINGGPIYWFDTLAYLHGGSTAIESLTGLETRYDALEKVDAVSLSGAERPSPQVEPSPGPDPDAADPAINTDYQISQARSVYYAMALSSLSMLGGSAAPALLAAALLVLAGIMLLRAVFDGRLTAPGLWMVAGVALSSIGVVAALLMPDVLAPLSILSIAVFFSFHDRLSGFAKLFWAVLLGVSAISHSTHIVVALFLLPIGALLAAGIRRKDVLRPVLWCAAPLVATLMANAAFTHTVEALYGYRPLALPMIAASLITDEPGRSFLIENCPEVDYVYCGQLDTRATETDQFLWSTDPEIGVYEFADLETRRAMSEQQFSFFLDTLRYDGVGQISVSLARFWEQLFDDGLYQTTYNDAQRQALQTLPEPDRSVALKTGLYRKSVSFVGFGWIAHYVALLSAVAAFVMIVVLWSKSRRTAPDVGDASIRALTVFALLLLAGILANSGLTGAFSQPQGRYAARVMVLLPLLASVLGAWMSRNYGLFKEGPSRLGS